MISALQTGITTLARTVSGLSSSNLFYYEAKHGSSLPYCVFQDITPGEFDYDSLNQFDKTYVQFSFFGTTLSALQTMIASFKSIFDFGESSLTVTGYSVIRIDRINEYTPSKENKVWQLILEYSFEIQKARS